MKSNCLVWAICYWFVFGGKISWRPGWRRGWHYFPSNPFGHWRIKVGGKVGSFQPYNRELPVWRQLWFDGYVEWR